MRAEIFLCRCHRFLTLNNTCCAPCFPCHCLRYSTLTHKKILRQSIQNVNKESSLERRGACPQEWELLLHTRGLLTISHSLL